MSRIWAGLGVLVCLLAYVSPAASEPKFVAREGNVDAGVFVGGDFFSRQVELGNSFASDQVPGSAFMFGARGTYLLLDIAPQTEIDPRLSAELELKLAMSSTSSDASSMRSSYFAPVFGWRAHAVVDFLSDKKISPFALIGFGAETVFTSSPFVASGDTDAAFFWGIGGTYKIKPKYGVRADLRHGITAGRTDAVSNIFEVHVGFYYSFSLGKRTPNIGKKVFVDKVPPDKDDTDKDDAEELASKDGDTPDEPKDSDGDGIPDDDDQCPDKPETVNDIDDEDGCPEEDEDGDKILGSNDSCPDEAEDMDGFEDEDGCPDKDNDGDGRVDHIDACPMKPETLNGYADADGCPDEVPAAVTKMVGVLKGVAFHKGAKLTKRSFKALKGLLAKLKKYEDVDILILVHTDAKLPPQVSIALSQKRAESLQAYLVKKGIDADRLEANGVGSDKPLVKNKKSKKNNRVELQLIVGPKEMPDPGPPATTMPDELDKPASGDALK